MAAELEAQDVFARLVRVDHPFHHPLMRPASEELEAALADLTPQPEAVPFFSTVTGGRYSGEACDAAHWGRGIREPVRFAPAVHALAEFGVDVWLELSAHPALARATQECLSAGGGKAIIVSSTRRDHELESALEAAMDLHRAGVPLDFSAITPSRHLLSLPAYAWEKSRWWNETSDWRDSRLAPGGRGLLDVRLPRAMPTWVTRLDAQHMAFLKDHKVENHVIFPAAAFVEMALEAGVQLFEGRPFVVEDFEIRKPLILPDPPSSVQIEFSYSPNERTFAIQSRFEQSVAWSLHVVGSLRGERTESSFASTKWGEPAGEPVGVEDFYRHMSDLGLRYGAEFQPIRELSAAAGRSTGRVALSEAISPRAGEYAVHPVLFDGALQVFSAGAATIEDRQARMKLPVRFHPHPVPWFARCLDPCAGEGAANLATISWKAISRFMMSSGSRACWWTVSGPSAFPAPGRSLPGGMRDLTYHVAWERTPNDNKTLLSPLALEELRATAQAALDRVIETRGRSELEAVLVAVDHLTAAQLARGLREMGVSVESAFRRRYARRGFLAAACFCTLRRGTRARMASRQKGEWMGTNRDFAEAADSAQTVLREFIKKHPAQLPEALLCRGELHGAGSNFARRKGCCAGVVLRHRRGFARSVLRRRSLHQPLAWSDGSGGEPGGAEPPGRSRAAHPRNRRRHRWTGFASLAAPRTQPALLHFQRCFRRIFLRRRAETGGVSGSGVQTFRSRKTGRRTGTSRRERSISSSARTSSMPSMMCAPLCAMCTIFSRRAEVSFSWIRPRRNCGRKPFSD